MRSVFSVHLMAALFAVGFATGCERLTTPSRYSVVLGDVTACQNDIGEITVNVVRRAGQDVTGESLHCTVTGDSEIYVNDRFSTLSDVQPGDRVELIGYRDANPSVDRFTVTYAHIQHALVPATADAIDAPPKE